MNNVVISSCDKFPSNTSRRSQFLPCCSAERGSWYKFVKLFNKIGSASKYYHYYNVNQALFQVALKLKYIVSCIIFKSLIKNKKKKLYCIRIRSRIRSSIAFVVELSKVIFKMFMSFWNISDNIRKYLNISLK